MGIGYDDHSLYHWPTPRALATARHLISEGTSGSLDGEGDITADLALHIGDIAYGTGYGAKWDRFMEQMEPLGESPFPSQSSSPSLSRVAIPVHTLHTHALVHTRLPTSSEEDAVHDEHGQS